VPDTVKIAWFTPLSCRSAIGEFSVHVTAELAKLAEVELWTADEPPFLDTELPVVPYSQDSRKLDSLAGRDAIVYNMGDYLPFHRDIFAVSRNHPGVVILHDRVLHHLFAGMWLMGTDSTRQLYIERMRAYYGEPGAEVARASLEGECQPVWESDEEVLGYPLYEESILTARGVVTHSESQARDVHARWLGPVRALHLPCYRDVLRRADGAPARASDGPLRLLTVGHLNPNKQVHRVVEMLAADPELAARVHYTVVGPNDDFKAYVNDLRRFIDRHADRMSVEILGWQPDDELDRLMSQADVFVNLRHPVMEGSSASLMKQLAYARPVLCFESGFFGELPEGALMRVAPGDFLAAAQALRELVEDPERCKQMGHQARALAAAYDERTYVDGLLALIEASRRAAPTMDFLDSVARELGHMGVDSLLPTFDEIANDFARILPI
jgi:glycosyltransferase involved in cell wall biosynthesis